MRALVCACTRSARDEYDLICPDVNNFAVRPMQAYPIFRSSPPWRANSITRTAGAKAICRDLGRAASTSEHCIDRQHQSTGKQRDDGDRKFLRHGARDDMEFI